MKHEGSQENNVLTLYKDIVDRAHKEIHQVRSVYKWLGTLIALIITVGIVYTFKTASDFRTETKQEIRDLKTEVDKRVDRELGSEALQNLIKRRIETHVDRNAEKIIKDRLNNEVIPKIEKAENEISEIGSIIEQMRTRINITTLADKAIADASREAMDEILKIYEANKEDSPLRVAAAAEKARVISFLYLLRRRGENLPLKKSNGSVAKASDYSTKELGKLLLQDERWDVRMQAAIYLANRREKEAVKALLQSLKKEKDLGVVRESLKYYQKIIGKKYGLLEYDKAIKDWDENKEEILKMLE